MTKRNGKGAHLTPDPKNARRHGERNKSLIRESLETVGPLRSIGVDGDNIIRAGNGVYDQAQALGLKVRIVDAAPDELIAVRRPDLKGKRAIEAALFDNRAGEVESTWNVDVLAEIAERDGDLLRRMFEGDKDVLAAIGPQEQADAEPQIDRAEELNKKWQVKTGDLWRIGEHRLLCGDSARREDVKRVMQGERAQLVVTSPPYGVGKDYEHGGIDEWLQLIRGCFSCCATIAPTWFVNLANRRTGNNGYEANTFALMEHEFDSLGVKLVSLRVWIKQPAWSSSNPYWTQTYKPVDDFEFLGTFAKQKPKFKKRLTDAEYRDWGWRGIWEVASVRQNDIHSAMFPIELPSRAVKLLTDDGETIYDPFCGSGTTIVACQNLHRKCRAIEIIPAYCAVTIERMSTAFPGIEIERLNASTQKPKAHRKRTQTAAA